MRAAEAGMGGWAAQSAAARRAASERFSADRWIAETEEVYRSVMGNG
jgi:hypothetical protein